jgi:GNAT superfamily N-acetyltransferase
MIPVQAIHKRADLAQTQITLVETPAERHAVYAFRYSIIVEELGVDLPVADHTRKLVVDIEDQTSYIFAAYRDGRIIGTIRSNILLEGLVEPHCTLLNLLSKEADSLDVVSVTGRLLVSPSLRGGPLAIRLCQACYGYGIEKGIQRDYILVKSNLLRLYQRLGYRSIIDSVVHPEIGSVVGLMLDLGDVASLTPHYHPKRPY